LYYVRPVTRNLNYSVISCNDVIDLVDFIQQHTSTLLYPLLQKITEINEKCYRSGPQLSPAASNVSSEDNIESEDIKQAAASIESAEATKLEDETSAAPERSDSANPSSSQEASPRSEVKDEKDSEEMRDAKQRAVLTNGGFTKDMKPLTINTQNKDHDEQDDDRYVAHFIFYSISSHFK
jgi:hypothetical protein